MVGEELIAMQRLLFVIVTTYIFRTAWIGFEARIAARLIANWKSVSIL